MDLALVNAFIVFNAKRVQEGKSKMAHVRFLATLQSQLITLHDGDLSRLETDAHALTALPSLHAVSQRHMLTQSKDTRKGNKDGSQKLRQRTCKVCSVLRASNQRARETTWCCSACKDHRGSAIYLCRQSRGDFREPMLSCFEIWHLRWRNGKLRPKRGRKLRARPPASSSTVQIPEKRPRTSE